MKMEQTECSETSAYKNSDAGELPRRKHTTFRTQQKFEIKNVVKFFEMFTCPTCKQHEVTNRRLYFLAAPCIMIDCN